MSKPEGWKQDNKRHWEAKVLGKASLGKNTEKPKYLIKPCQSVEDRKNNPDWFEYPLPQRIKDRDLDYNYYLSHAEALAKELDWTRDGYISEGTVYEKFRILIEMMIEANAGTPSHEYWYDLYKTMPKTVLDADLNTVYQHYGYNPGFQQEVAESIVREMKKSYPDPNYIEEKIRHLSEIQEMTHRGTPDGKRWNDFRDKMMGRKGR